MASMGTGHKFIYASIVKLLRQIYRSAFDGLPIHLLHEHALQALLRYCLFQHPLMINRQSFSFVAEFHCLVTKDQDFFCYVAVRQ